MEKLKTIDLLKRLYNYGEVGLTIDANIAREIEEMIDILESESEPEPTEYINHFACTKQYLINLITIIRDGPLAFNASEPVMEHLNALFARLIKDGINIDRLTAELKTKDKALQNIIDESGKVDKSNWPRQQQLCQVIAQEVLKYGE